MEQIKYDRSQIVDIFEAGISALYPCTEQDEFIEYVIKLQEQLLKLQQFCDDEVKYARQYKEARPHIELQISIGLYMEKIKAIKCLIKPKEENNEQ